MWFRGVSETWADRVRASHLWISFFWNPPMLFSILDFLASFYWFTGFIFLVFEARKPVGFVTYATAAAHARWTALSHRQNSPERGIYLYDSLFHLSPQNVHSPHKSFSFCWLSSAFVSCSGFMVVSWGVVVVMVVVWLCSSLSYPESESFSFLFFKEKTFYWDFVV